MQRGGKKFVSKASYVVINPKHRHLISLERAFKIRYILHEYSNYPVIKNPRDQPQGPC